MILAICHLMSACLSLELTGKHAKSRRLFRRWDRLGRIRRGKHSAKQFVSPSLLGRSAAITPIIFALIRKSGGLASDGPLRAASREGRALASFGRNDREKHFAGAQFESFGEFDAWSLR